MKSNLFWWGVFAGASMWLARQEGAKCPNCGAGVTLLRLIRTQVCPGCEQVAGLALRFLANGRL